ncbi:MAG: AI-2E family transporter [Bdellovibrionia bacterium]
MSSEFNSPSRTAQVILKHFFLATLIVAAELIIFSIRWILLLFAIGIGIGVILAPSITWIEKKLRIPRFLGTLFFILSVTAFLAITSYLSFDLLSEQALSAQRQFPLLLATLREKSNQLQAQYPAWIQFMEGLNFGAAFYSASQHLLKGFQLGASVVAGGILVIVIALYTANAPHSYLEGVLCLIPPHLRSLTQETLEAAADSLRRWFQAQLLAIGSVGVCTAVGLWILGVEYWFLIGVIAGVLDIIPYVGSILPASAALFLTLANHPEKFIWVLVLFIVIHQFENHLLIPTVMKHQMDFPPLLLIFFMLIMANWFGILGILITTGLFSVLRTLYLKLYVPWISADHRLSTEAT